MTELPRMPLHLADSLPQVSAVYTVTGGDGESDDWVFLYVGQAINLRNRLTRHNKMHLFLPYFDVHVHWLELPIERLDVNEYRAIEKYKPLFNKNMGRHVRARMEMGLPTN